MFKCYANIAFRIKELPDKEEEGKDEEESLKQIAKLIRVEGKEIPREETTYKQKLVKFELKRFRLSAAAAARRRRMQGPLQHLPSCY